MYNNYAFWIDLLSYNANNYQSILFIILINITNEKTNNEKVGTLNEYSDIRDRKATTKSEERVETITTGNTMEREHEGRGRLIPAGRHCGVAQLSW